MTFGGRAQVEAAAIGERIREIVGRAADEYGVELVHAEVAGTGRQTTVRIFIDKPGGVTHADCSNMSRHVGTVLDVEDFINSAYTLEVSSPGLERGLYQRGDYERFAGSLAKLKTRDAINGQRNFRGRILRVEGEEVIFEDKVSGQVRIPLAGIAKANLEIDVEEEFRLAAEREKAANKGGATTE
ncbi:MAG: ribosome maturation factor RimP [Pyrinomonadaceae bacterium]|nr:ribosome maturation factor RimP [Pyrinomonadaceae bacterium]